ncbi:DUF3168 domain-containing protein [Novosphingobium sp. 1949]|uniref:DUF3168 domain-containing protein n=1 Tax=Novosphingobium organovorum TaxID=2930092 RepID=A0ABT0BGQ0_9SPHN|nr:DUF3168 domain-containing protein [Novosphingobium organovorum]MCJ2184228.1 DUF3168 domain-containing protein [Novosphingobium organovorum]
MEESLRLVLVEWLRSDGPLAGELNTVCEEAPARTSLPWLAIATSASTDWSTKTEIGREVRIALELHCRGDAPGSAAALTAAIEARLARLPTSQAGFAVISQRFLRARCEQRAGNRRSILLEYAFRLLAN